MYFKQKDDYKEAVINKQYEVLCMVGGRLDGQLPHRIYVAYFRLLTGYDYM